MNSRLVQEPYDSITHSATTANISKGKMQTIRRSNYDTDMECVHSNLIKLCVIHCSSPSVHKLARKFLATELSKYFSLKMYKNNVRSTNYASSSSALLLLCHSCLSICSLILTSSALKKFVIRLRSLSHLQKSVKFCWSAAYRTRTK